VCAKPPLQGLSLGRLDAAVGPRRDGGAICCFCGCSCSVSSAPEAISCCTPTSVCHDHILCVGVLCVFEVWGLGRDDMTACVVRQSSHPPRVPSPFGLRRRAYSSLSDGRSLLQLPEASVVMMCILRVLAFSFSWTTNHFATRLSPCSELSGNNTADDLVRTASPLHAELWCPADRLIGALFGPSPRAMVQGTRVQTMVSGDCCCTLTHSASLLCVRVSNNSTSHRHPACRAQRCFVRVCVQGNSNRIGRALRGGWHDAAPTMCVSERSLSLSLPLSL
jgi:hypothetical protein